MYLGTYVHIYIHTYMYMYLGHVCSLPLVCEGVKLPIELAHSDGLGVEHIGVHRLKGHPSRCGLALQGREGIAQHLIALRLPRDGGPDQHESMANDSCFVELDAFLNKALLVLQTLCKCAFTDASL